MGVRDTQAGNRAMNRLIFAAARRGERTVGGVDRLAGVPEHGARMRAALSDLEAAQRSGDDVAIGYAEHLLDKAVEAARAARGDQPRDEQGQFVGYDGGVRRTAPQPRSISQQMNQLILAASRGSFV